MPRSRPNEYRPGVPTRTADAPLTYRVQDQEMADAIHEPEPVLAVRNLSVSIRHSGSVLQPVRQVNFTIQRGKTLCLVGESGSGKSLTALTIMRLAELESASVAEGTVRFCGIDLLPLSQSELRFFRGWDIALVPQEPLTALNPVLRIGRQLVDVWRYHEKALPKDEHLTKAEFTRRIERALIAVGLGNAREVMQRYPHQLSGGMRQRVMIAMAMIAEPRLIIADEPTTALDVTTQAQILALLKELQARTGVAILLITHDLAVAAQLADDIAVMYAGRIVERAEAPRLFSDHVHPYTRGLLDSIPNIEGERKVRLHAIPGAVPSVQGDAAGCAFAPRCEHATTRCSEELPPLDRAGDDSLAPSAAHVAACWNPIGHR